MLTIKEVAVELKVHPVTVYKLIAEEGLPATRYTPKGRYKIDPDELQKWKMSKQSTNDDDSDIDDIFG